MYSRLKLLRHKLWISFLDFYAKNASIETKNAMFASMFTSIFGFNSFQPEFQCNLLPFSVFIADSMDFFLLFHEFQTNSNKFLFFSSLFETALEPCISFWRNRPILLNSLSLFIYKQWIVAILMGKTFTQRHALRCRCSSNTQENIKKHWTFYFSTHFQLAIYRAHRNEILGLF